MPWILTPPKGWTLGRSVWLVAVTSLAAVAVMLVHSIGAGSLLSLVYAMIGGAAVAVWLTIRRESAETARGADALIIAVLLLLLRTADPAFEWLAMLSP
jgi:hypothetical protein